MYTISIEDTEDCFSCAAGQNVLAAMEKLGRKSIPVGCRGGGCGVCRVQVVGSGQYRTLKMSKAQVSETDAENGIALACKLVPEADLCIKPLGLLEQRINSASKFLQKSRGGV